MKDPEQPRAGIVIACSALKKIYRDILRGVTTESGEAKRENTDLDTHFLYREFKFMFYNLYSVLWPGDQVMKLNTCLIK